MQELELLDTDERSLAERLLPLKALDIILDPVTVWNKYLNTLDPLSRRLAIKGRRSMRVYRHHACHWPTPKHYPRAR